MCAVLLLVRPLLVVLVVVQEYSTEEQGMGWNKRSHQIDAYVQGWGCIFFFFAPSCKGA